MKRFKSLLTWIMVLAMMLEMVPMMTVAAFAEEATEQVEVSTVEAAKKADGQAIVGAAEPVQASVLTDEGLLTSYDSACVGSMFYLYLAVKGDEVRSVSGNLVYDKTQLTLVDAVAVPEGWAATLTGDHFTVGDEWTPEETDPAFAEEGGKEVVAFRFMVNKSVLANETLQVKATELTVADAKNEGVMEDVTWQTTASREDTEAPVVTTVELDKTNVTVGDTINVTATVEDESVVNEVRIEFYRSGNRQSSWEYCHLYLDQEDQKYHGTVTVSDDDYDGNYTIDSVYTCDSAGNSKSQYSYDIRYALRSVQFTVTGNPEPIAPVNPSGDVTPPVVSGVSFDKASYSVGDTVTVSVMATDDTSLSRGYIQLRNDRSQKTYSTYVYESGTAGVMSGAFYLNDYAASGIWYVTSNSYVYDTSSNYTYLPQNAASFTVAQNDNEDLTAPVLVNIEAENRYYSAKDTVTITLTATDDNSGLYGGYITIQNGSTDRSYSSNWYYDNDKDGKIECKITLDQYAPSGVYFVDRVQLQDRANNYSYYYADSDQVDQNENAQLLPESLRGKVFTLRKNPNEDLTPPVVESVTFDKAEYGPEETVTISAKVTDDVSGVSRVYLWLQDSRGQTSEQIRLNLDNDGLYKATYPIGKYARSGAYSIWNIDCYDKANNWGEYYRSSNYYSSSSDHYRGDFNADVANAGFIVNNPNEDVTAPVLNGISLNKSSYGPNDIVRVTFDVTEEESGLYMIWVYFENEAGTQFYYNRNARYCNTDAEGNYVLDVTLSPYVASGTYHVSHVELGDNSENWINLYRNNNGNPLPQNVQSISFTVDNPNGDGTPPEVTGLTFDKGKSPYMGGQTVEMSLSCVDAPAGFNDGNIYFRSENQNQTYQVYFSRSSMNVNGEYTAKLKLPDYIPSGNYRIYQCWFRDNADNEVNYYSWNNDRELPEALRGVYFKVDNVDQDITAPVLTDISLNKDAYNATETATISVGATDENSGLNYAEVYFYNAQKNKYVNTTISNKTDDGLAGSMNFSKWQAAGNYVLKWVYLTDICGNMKSYSEADISALPTVLQSISFDLTNPNEDVTAPVVESVTFDKETYGPGETVNITATVSDDVSGVSSVDLNFVNPQRSGTYIRLTGTNGVYRGSYKVGEYDQTGKYSIYRVACQDNAGNYKNYNKDAGTLPAAVGAASFTVENPNQDVTPPELVGITLDKSSYAPGDTITATIEATDSQSGLEGVEVYFTNEDGRELSWNSGWCGFNNDGKYVDEQGTNEYVHSGTYTVNRVILTDNVGNRIWLYRSQHQLPASVEAISFTINNPNEDNTPPTLNGISADMSNFQPGDELWIKVDAADAKSGVSNAWVYLQNEDGKMLASDWWSRNDGDGWYNIYNTSPYMASGTYTVYRVEMRDRAGNYVNLNRYSADMPQSVRDFSITINNPNEDITPPEIRSVELDTSALATTGAVTVKASITDNKSGINYASIYIYGNNYGREYSMDQGADGYYYATFYPDQDYKDGVYWLDSINSRDNAGNYGSCGRGKSGFPEDCYFQIGTNYDMILGNGAIDEADAAAERIAATSDTAVIYWDTYGNHEIAKEILAAIQGSHRTLVLQSDNVTLKIRGQDVPAVPENIYANCWGRICKYVVTANNTTLLPCAVLHCYGNDTGAIPFPVTVSVDLSRYDDAYQNLTGLYLYRCNYNNDAELIGEGMSIQNGVLELTFSPEMKAGEYYLTQEKAVMAADIHNDSGTCGESTTWAFDAASRTLTISGSGAMENYRDNNGFGGLYHAPWVKYAAFIEKIQVENGVTGIGNSAFEFCRNVTSVSLPDSLVSIGKSAFRGCGISMVLTIPNSVTTIDNDAFIYADISQITFGNKLSYIGNNAFNGSTLQSITIPGTVTALGYSAFYNCGQLQSVTIQSSLKEIPYNTFGYCESLSSISIPSTVTTISYGGFQGCTSLREVNIPYGVKSIEDYAYADCTRLKKVTIPASVEYIAPTAFYGCSINEYIVDGDNTNYKRVGGVLYDADMTVVLGCDSSVTSVNLPNTVTEISYGAFKNCTKLTSISMPSGLKTIRQDAFANCTSLSDVTLPKNLEFLGGAAFINCTALSSVKLPAALRQIEWSTFDGCIGLTDIQVASGNPNYSSRNGLLYSNDGSILNICPQGKTSVDVPSGTTEIGYCAFHDCEKLKSVTLPDTIKLINAEAFRSCIKLTELTVPASVEEISWGAFANCRNLISVQFFGDKPIMREGAVYSFLGSNVTCYYPCTNKTWANLEPITITAEETADYGYGENVTSVVWEKTHNWDAGQVTKAPTKTEEGNTKYTCVLCHEVGNSSIPALGFDTEIEDMAEEGVEAGDIVYVDGEPTVVNDDGSINIQGTDVTSIVAFTTNDPTEEDVHKQYPTEIKVWITTYDESTGSYKAVRMEEFDDCLQYAGSAIRVTGKKGIRMVTSVPADLKSRLTGNGLEGFYLYEYGTLVAWDHELRGEPLVFGSDVVKSAYAYRRGVADPVFKTVGDLTQYTNVLVGFSLEQCKPDLAMRPYIILKDAQGNDYTIYGGEVHRSIAYIAYQNRAAFNPGTDAYDYLWEIIHYAYGDRYDAEYEG